MPKGDHYVTARMIDLLRRMSRYYARNGQGPCANELAISIGITVSSVSGTVERMHAQGLVRWVWGESALRMGGRHGKGSGRLPTKRWTLLKKGEAWL